MCLKKVFSMFTDLSHLQQLSNFMFMSDNIVCDWRLRWTLLEVDYFTFLFPLLLKAGNHLEAREVDVHQMSGMAIFNAWFFIATTVLALSCSETTFTFR